MVAGAIMDVHKLEDDFKFEAVEGAVKEWLKHAPKRASNASKGTTSNPKKNVTKDSRDSSPAAA